MSDLLHLLTTAYGTSLHIALQNLLQILARSRRLCPPQRGAHFAPAGVLQLSPIDEDAGIQHAMRVEPLFDCFERISKKLRSLAVVPGTMIATERMVVRDCSAGIDHGI